MATQHKSVTEEKLKFCQFFNNSVQARSSQTPLYPLQGMVFGAFSQIFKRS